MSERDRLQGRIRNLESIEQGLQSNISDYQQGIIRAQREKADAGRHSDALERSRAADSRIRDLESSIRGAKNEIGRVRHQIRGLQSEIASLR